MNLFKECHNEIQRQYTCMYSHCCSTGFNAKKIRPYSSLDRIVIMLTSWTLQL